jgi:gamma-glutamyltranspeptidase/glutathione hydrolase
MTLLRAFLVLVLLVAPTTRSALAAPAAVATAEPHATRAGVDTLRAGGNAVDAAVAIAFALAVSYPVAGNLGGGGFATLVFGGKPYFLDYRESAPSAASAGMYLDANGEVIPHASTIGARAAAVPGTVAGLWALHRRFGRLPWPRVLAPAIGLARDGFAIVPAFVAEANDRAHELAGRTNFERYFGGLAAGHVLRQRELAAVLRRIAAGGAAAFYQGRTAALVAASMRRHGGLITAADLGAYRTAWRAPLEGDWAGYHVVTAPLPSSGGIALLSLFGMRADLDGAFAGVGHNSAQYVHLLAEMEKRVFADRAGYLGDPDYTDAPVAALLAPAYLSRRAAEVSLGAPTPTSAVHAGIAQHHDTTHFSVVDHDGNAVSNTFTLNDDFGSGLVVEGAGFLLNNEMDDFSAKPGVPNLFGVVGGDANAIAPQKRPLSTMTPTILTAGGRVAVVIGTPGGSRIATSIYQVLAAWHDFRLPIAAAVAAPRIHHQLLPPDTLYEEPYGTLAADVRTALAARGYRFEDQGWNGDIEAIVIDGTTCAAVSDPRGHGEARVVD